MITKISHPTAGIGPVGFAMALEVAYALHAPEPPTRPPEVTVPQMMGLRLAPAHPHRHKVPLKRLTGVRG